MPTLNPNLKSNLTTLGKIQKGDLLVLKPNGLLELRTNWLSGALRKGSPTSPKDIDGVVTAIDQDLTKAATVVVDDPAHVEELRSILPAAYRGLDRLISTYRSRGDALTEATNRLAHVIAQHFASIGGRVQTEGVAPGPMKLKTIAADAIRFVEDAKIQSTNNFWEPASFDSKTDQLLLMLLVRVTHMRFNEIRLKDLRNQIKAVLASKDTRTVKQAKIGNILMQSVKPGSPNGAALQPKEVLEHWYRLLNSIPDSDKVKYAQKSDVLGLGWPVWWSRALSAEDLRIRCVRKAMKARLGNCLEKSCIVATHIAEATHGQIGICRVCPANRPPSNPMSKDNYDHNFVLISMDANLLYRAFSRAAGTDHPWFGDQMSRTVLRKELPDDTWVVDGWTLDCWALQDYFNSVGNPRQLVVRHRIRTASEKVGLALLEDVRWPPSGKHANFRLRFAELAHSDTALAEIRKTLGPVTPEFEQVLDNRASISSGSFDSSLCNDDDD